MRTAIKSVWILFVVLCFAPIVGRLVELSKNIEWDYDFTAIGLLVILSLLLAIGFVSLTVIPFRKRRVER